MKNNNVSRRSFLKTGVGLTAASELHFSLDEQKSALQKSDIKIGFLTVPLQTMPIEEVIVWAGQVGFHTLEIPCDPPGTKGKIRHLEAESFTQADAARLKSLLHRNNLKVSSLVYYPNHLHQDLNEREIANSHIRKVIDAAAMMDVRIVCTFVGRDNSKTIHENIDLATRIMTPIVRYAGDKGIKIAIENCPMEGWHPEAQPGQIFYSPEIWAALFETIPDRNFGFNFDPSHLFWQQIDIVNAVRHFRNRIFHTHGKDTDIMKDGLNKYGIFGKKLNKESKWDAGWWTYRIPGNGMIDWKSYIKALKEINYSGVISLEHEDPVFSGSDALNKEGLIRGKQYLSLII